MSISDIRASVSKEFGLYIPYNIAVKCLSIIENEGIIELSDHQVKRTGSFDTDAFDHERDAYRKTETALIQALISYVSQYGLRWSFEYAREQLIKVLDKTALLMTYLSMESLTVVVALSPLFALRNSMNYYQMRMLLKMIMWIASLFILIAFCR